MPTTSAPAALGWTSGDFPWKRSFHPRRGGVPGPPISLDADATAKVEALIAAGAEPIASISRDSVSHLPLIKALRSYLDGEPDPLGAAILFEVLTAGGRRPAGMFVDHWVKQHGLAFAVAAVGHSAATFTVSWTSYGVRPDGEKGPIAGRLSLCSTRYFDWSWNSSGVVRLRALLAAAGDEEYREAVAVLAGLRERGRSFRKIAAFLAPAETEWVDELLPDLAKGWQGITWLLWCSLSTEAHLAALTAAYEARHRDLVRLPVLSTLADAYGERIVPLVARILEEEHSGSEEAKAIAAVLGGIPTDEAFGLLLRHRDDNRHLTAGLFEAMRAFPVRAMRLLDAASASPKAAGLLRDHLLGHPELLEGDLPPRAKELAGKLRRLPEAPLDSLPELLAAPPWTRPRAKTAQIVLELEPPAHPAELRWLPGEREEWAAKADSYPSGRNIRRPHLKSLESGEGIWALNHYLMHGPEDDARSLLEYWAKPDRYGDDLDVMAAIAARFGLEALPRLRASAEASPAAGRLLLPFSDLATARLMAGWLRLKSARGTARTWLTRHGAALLIPDALGEPGRARTAAEAALRIAPGALEAARAHGPAAEEAVAALLGADPLEDLPRRMPTLPAWADPGRLPQPRLADGRALPAAATAHVLSMLAISRPDAVYAGLATVKEVCTPQSLDVFSWELFEAWRRVGLPAKDGWALTALGILGGDTAVRNLTPMIKAWPGEGGHQRAVAGLDVLAAIGSDVALMHLHGIGQRLRFKALKERAKQKIDEVAEALGLDSEQLADRLVPDLGLGEDGSTVLDYGPRRFTVGFDEQLRPYVLDEDGRIRKALPAPGAKDDPELAAAARQRFSGLKKDVRTIASRQIQRLERAMVRTRSWTPGEFRELFAEHPLQRHLIRRLVFLCDAGAFRVAEDGTLAGVDDEAFTLPDGTRVRIAHPIHLGPDLDAWSELFADYEILQPFPQLGRPVITLDPGETLSSRLARFEAATVPAAKILSLQYRGWERGDAGEGATVHRYTRELPSGRHLTIDFSPGLTYAHPDDELEQTLQAVGIEGRQGAEDDPDESADTVTVSEVIVDLTALTS
ncbi:DUF4132 domain-containing protein [Actinocorallia longicatena]|uniref:DUF4132 domain-containing protein n=1 Tax=Actinocorallia longicatena TaxID=111803 RepID=A0ABP6PWG4_9ACTN